MSIYFNGNEYRKAVSIMEDKVLSKNEDGTWSEAVPYPFIGIRKSCGCGRKFFTMKRYESHYRREHSSGKRYDRTPKGLVEHTYRGIYKNGG